MEEALTTASARRAYGRIQRLTGSGIADGGFLATLSGLLREIIPFDAACWAAVDPLTLLATSPARLENIGSSAVCGRYWDNEFFDEDVNQFRTLARLPSPASSLHQVTGGHPARSRRHRTLNRSLGFGDELRCVFRTGDGVWGYTCLWREEDAPPFSVDEERLLAGLAAPIGRAFRRSTLLRSAAPGEFPETPGLLTFDHRGALESLNESAEAWLSEFTLVRSSHDGPEVIPTPIGLPSVVSKAQAIAVGRATGTARARLLIHGRWLVIHAFALRAVNAEGHKTAVVIQPANATEMAPLIAQAYQLGRREQQITRLVAGGLSTKEIAAKLYLSTHTIRDYLKQVFEKVGVTTRGELVAKIFTEHYKETLNPEKYMSS